MGSVPADSVIIQGVKQLICVPRARILPQLVPQVSTVLLQLLLVEEEGAHAGKLLLLLPPSWLGLLLQLLLGSEASSQGRSAAATALQGAQSSKTVKLHLK